MFYSIIAICIGASLGAVLRWLLGIALNALMPSIPLGTLIANYMGCYLIGVALALFANHPEIAPEWRLFVITGFLGGLTTFLTFSAETITLIQQDRLLWAASAIGLHVIGSLLMTVLGLATITFFKNT